MSALALDETIGRQAPLRLTDAHRTPRCMKPHADLRRRLDAVVEPHAVRKEIEVVAGRRATRQQQLDHRRLRRDAHHLGGEVRPKGIERAQPAEQFHIGRDRPGQALEHVVMRVDQTGHHDLVARIDHLVGMVGQVAAGTHRLDHVVAHQHRSAGNLATPGVHRDQKAGVADQERAHRAILRMAPWLPAPCGGFSGMGRCDRERGNVVGWKHRRPVHVRSGCRPRPRPWSGAFARAQGTRRRRTAARRGGADRRAGEAAREGAPSSR